ncbi:hypothetical protein L7F22_017459 [Adiantum nelumboides]|nr:hypothetical protein [Adiantum nelumboides]
MTQWFSTHGLDIQQLPPFQYDPDSPLFRLSHEERNRVLGQDLWQLYIKETWITPRQPLPSKMLYYRDQFMTILEDGFIQRPRYMDVYMPHSARVAIGQLRVSSHRLEIEAGRAAHISREHRICRICRAEVESEEHYVCSCRAYHGRLEVAAADTMEMKWIPWMVAGLILAHLFAFICWIYCLVAEKPMRRRKEF